MPLPPVAETDLSRSPSCQTVWLPAEPSAVAEARQLVDATLAAWGVDADCRDDAVLLTSELVGNVVSHSSARGVGLRVEATDGRVRVSVQESTSSATPGPDDHLLTDFRPAVTPSSTEVSGRGLQILDALAGEWGISRIHRCTSTWFTLAPAEPLPLDLVNPRAAAELRSVRAGLQRTQLLLRVTEHLGAAVTAQEVGVAIARHLTEALGAVFVGIALVDLDSLTSVEPTMSYLDLSVFPPEVRARWSRFPLGSDAPVAAVARHGAAQFHADAAAAEAAHPGIAEHMRAAGTGAMVHLPLMADGFCLGTLALAWRDARSFDADTVALLTIVTGYAAQALHRRDRVSDAVATARRTLLRATADYDEALSTGASMPLLQRLDDDVRRATSAFTRAGQRAGVASPVV